jgi:hypothetical protein
VNNKLLIEVNNQDHSFVENVCLNKNFTFASFFSHLLDLYKKSIEKDTQEPEQEVLNEKVKTKRKKEWN